MKKKYFIGIIIAITFLLIIIAYLKIHAIDDTNHSIQKCSSVGGTCAIDCSNLTEKFVPNTEYEVKCDENELCCLPIPPTN